MNVQILKIRLSGKVSNFLCLCRSSSQIRDIFETFADNFLCLCRSSSQIRDIFETFADHFVLTLATLINKNSTASSQSFVLYLNQTL